MVWTDGIQKALDYIEDNLTEELDYEKIGKISFSSSCHFQRVFSIVCGYTFGEYIRNRRLSVAGVELASDKIKVIDVAVKYGYDNPDSLQKLLHNSMALLTRLRERVQNSAHFPARQNTVRAAARRY